MDTASWERYLLGARWFGGKGLHSRLVQITPLPWLTELGRWPALRVELAEVAFPDRSTHTYQLVASYWPAGAAGLGQAVGHTCLPELGEVDALEALGHPPSAAALVAALRDSPPPGMRWTDASSISSDAEPHLLRTEQSNSTLELGATALFKLFRKLEPGDNPDPEVLAALTGSEITPDLYGVWSAGGYDLAMFCQRVPDVQDGWAWATAACAAREDISAPARALGATLRELHTRLADSFGTGRRTGRSLAETFRRRFDRAAAQVPELAGWREPIHMIYRSLIDTSHETQRVHGDFHLGQALHRDLAGERRWVIIDFEGEPGRQLAERRELHSPLADVAGLLRSIDYVRRTVAEAEGRREWADAARAAFLAGYGKDRLENSSLLRAYELDKAVYEAAYEARNRPRWASIPLRAVQDEVRRTSSTSRATEQEQ